MKEIFIWGIKRSGNHMLADFILDHRKYDSISEIEDGKERQKIFRNKKIILNDYFKDRHYRKDLDKKKTIMENYPKFNERIPAPFPDIGDLQIISYELAPGISKQKFSNKINIFENNENVVPDIRNNHESEKYGIVVLRDPFNWATSLCKDPGRAKKLNEFIDLWISVAESFFINKPNDLYFPVNYNKFVEDKSYRNELSDFINEDFCDNGMNKVSSKGSSFDNHKFDGRAKEMKVNERWRKLPNNVLKEISKNRKLIELSEEIFDFNPLKES